jgi:branched-chain amino acid transport system substrate-binding protein
MQKRVFLRSAIATLVTATFGLHFGAANAEEKFKIGVIQPMTGPFASTGKQVVAGINTWMALHGNKVNGREIEVIVKDDGGVPANAKRIAQELIANEKVNILTGGGLTPLALAAASIATVTKTPFVIMAAETIAITNASPYAIRTSGTIPQTTIGGAEWAVKNGMKKVVLLVSDYGPGFEAEKTFKETFTKGGGQILDSLHVPLENPDFAPFLQKVRDMKPDAMFVMLPSGPGAAMLKQAAQRGFDKAGIKIICQGATTDDDNLNQAGDTAIGTISSDFYSAAHPSPMNKKFVEDFGKTNGGMRPNFFGVAAYDGMRVIYEAIKTAKDPNNGDALLAAMKGQSFESPRGKVTLDPQTRDFIQDIYIRKTEKVNGQLYNVEFDVIKDVLASGQRAAK